MRVPALGMAKLAAQAPGNREPRYPEAARRAGVEGRVVLWFVVDPNGRGDIRSVQVVESTTMEFVSSVLAAFPDLRFSPLELRGCRLASVVQMPFDFQLYR
jgi:protein TonB